MAPPACIPTLFNVVHLAFSANVLLPLHPRLQTSYPPSTTLYHPPSALSQFPHVFRCFIPPASSSYLQYNAGRLRTRSAERLHYISLYLVDFIFIQGSNINSSSSFRILGYFALRSDRTHSRSGILSPDDPHASGGLIIFVSQGLSFYKLSTSSPLFLCLNPSLIM